MIEIEYRTSKLKKVCTDAEYAIKVYGYEMAEKIHQRIGEISSAISVEMLIQYRIGRCHSLSQNRKGQYAMDLTHPYRLVFKKIDIDRIAVEILEIVDYH